MKDPNPCPRCGEIPVIEALEFGSWRVECRTCYADGYEDCTMVRRTMASAISEWNAWVGDMQDEQNQVIDEWNRKVLEEEETL